MIDNVRRALGPLGFWNALTPSEIASSPVSDEPPLANARSSTKIAAPDRIGLCWSTTGIIPAHPPGVVLRQVADQLAGRCR